MGTYDIFFKLHQQDRPFVMGNCWNAYSATILEKNGFRAIGTSSAAIARSLGYEDGENISFDELFFVVERILRSVSVPVSVDMESGYSAHTPQVISNVEKLHHAGVAGINIEDSRHGNLELTEVFAEKIYSIKNHLDRRNMKMFVNARTDCFLLRRPDCVECALERIRAYEDAGADGVFVPFISDLDNIRQIVAATSLPVNVMYLPELPSFEALAACGVARISMGTFLFSSVYRSLEALTPSLYEQGSFAWS